MIVGFSRHGTGRGDGPVGYITGPTSKVADQETGEVRTVERHPPPVVLAGEPELIRDLIDSIDNKWKYTSGVLSFAPGEVISPEMERSIIDRFEQTAFAGLDRDQYACLWVRHTHAGHHELHFVTPRIELTTGRALNIKPPGADHQERFDTFRSLVNVTYDLADPDDPMRSQMFTLPSWIQKAKTQGRDPREVIGDWLAMRIEKGLIEGRADVLASINEAGFEISRQGRDYVSVKDTSTGEKYRLRGAMYAEDFRPTPEARRELESRARAHRVDASRRVEALERKLEQFDHSRAQYHQERYRTPDRGREGESAPALQAEGAIRGTAVGGSLADYLRSHLGDRAIHVEPDTGAARAENNRRWEERSGVDRPSVDDVYRGGAENALQASGVMLDDEPRAAIVERLRRAISRAGEAASQCAEAVGRYARRIYDALGAFDQAQRGTFDAGRKLNEAGRQFDGPARRFDNALAERQKQIEAARSKERGRNRGMEL